MNNRRYNDGFSGKEKSNRHIRRKKQRRKEILKIYSVCTIGSGYYWSDTYSEFFLPDGDYFNRQTGKDFPASKAYPKRYYRGKRSKRFKKSCNRRFRNMEFDSSIKSNIYRRYTEFWWEIY